MCACVCVGACSEIVHRVKTIVYHTSLILIYSQCVCVWARKQQGGGTVFAAGVGEQLCVCEREGGVGEVNA